MNMYSDQQLRAAKENPATCGPIQEKCADMEIKTFATFLANSAEAVADLVDNGLYSVMSPRAAAANEVPPGNQSLRITYPPLFEQLYCDFDRIKCAIARIEYAMSCVELSGKSHDKEPNR